MSKAKDWKKTRKRAADLALEMGEPWCLHCNPSHPSTSCEYCENGVKTDVVDTLAAVLPSNTFYPEPIVGHGAYWVRRQLGASQGSRFDRVPQLMRVTKHMNFQGGKDTQVGWLGNGMHLSKDAYEFCLIRPPE